MKLLYKLNKNILFFVAVLFCLNIFQIPAYSSPYANPWLYDNMLEYFDNTSKYSDNVTHGIIKNSNDDVIISTYIEKAYNVYKKEEKYTPEIIFCGKGCYEDKHSKNIIMAYHKFFYIYAIAPEITEYLIQNPTENENIEYVLHNKTISYKWSNNKLIVMVDNEKIEFIKENNKIKINTNMQSLFKYRLN